jgi:alpha-1,4-digalacturonate transport system substrate-binding protein
MPGNGINPGREFMTIVARRSSFAAALGSASFFAMMSAGAAQAVDLDLMISDVDGKAGIVAEFAERYKAWRPT